MTVRVQKLHGEGEMKGAEAQETSPDGPAFVYLSFSTKDASLLPDVC